MTSLIIVYDNIGMQIGVRQVIAGWDEGILGDGKDVPPMKVTFSSLCMQQWLHKLLARVLCSSCKHLCDSHSSDARQ